MPAIRVTPATLVVREIWGTAKRSLAPDSIVDDDLDQIAVAHAQFGAEPNGREDFQNAVFLASCLLGPLRSEDEAAASADTARHQVHDPANQIGVEAELFRRQRPWLLKDNVQAAREEGSSSGARIRVGVQRHPSAQVAAAARDAPHQDHSSACRGRGIDTGDRTTLTSSHLIEPAVGGGQGRAGRPWFGDTWTSVVHQRATAFWRPFDLSMETRLTLIRRLARVPDMHEHLLWRFQRPRPASGRRAGAASQ